MDSFQFTRIHCKPDILGPPPRVTARNVSRSKNRIRCEYHYNRLAQLQCPLHYFSWNRDLIKYWISLWIILLINFAVKTDIYSIGIAVFMDSAHRIDTIFLIHSIAISIALAISISNADGYHCLPMTLILFCTIKQYLNSAHSIPMTVFAQSYSWSIVTELILWTLVIIIGLRFTWCPWNNDHGTSLHRNIIRSRFFHRGRIRRWSIYIVCCWTISLMIMLPFKQTCDDVQDMVTINGCVWLPDCQWPPGIMDTLFVAICFGIWKRFQLGNTDSILQQAVADNEQSVVDGEKIRFDIAMQIKSHWEFEIALGVLIHSVSYWMHQTMIIHNIGRDAFLYSEQAVLCLAVALAS